MSRYFVWGFFGCFILICFLVCLGNNSIGFMDFLYKLFRIFTCRNPWRKINRVDNGQQCYTYDEYSKYTCWENILSCLESIWHCLKNILSSLICDCKNNLCSGNNKENDKEFQYNLPV